MVKQRSQSKHSVNQNGHISVLNRLGRLLKLLKAVSSSEQDVLRDVQTDGINLKYVDNQTDEICLAAVTQMLTHFSM